MYWIKYKILSFIYNHINLLMPFALTILLTDHFLKTRERLPFCPSIAPFFYNIMSSDFQSIVYKEDVKEKYNNIMKILFSFKMKNGLSFFGEHNTVTFFLPAINSFNHRVWDRIFYHWYFAFL